MTAKTPNIADIIAGKHSEKGTFCHIETHKNGNTVITVKGTDFFSCQGPDHYLIFDAEDDGNALYIDCISIPYITLDPVFQLPENSEGWRRLPFGDAHYRVDYVPQDILDKIVLREGESYYETVTTKRLFRKPLVKKQFIFGRYNLPTWFGTFHRLRLTGNVIVKYVPMSIAYEMEIMRKRTLDDVNEH